MGHEIKWQFTNYLLVASQAVCLNLPRGSSQSKNKKLYKNNTYTHYVWNITPCLLAFTPVHHLYNPPLPPKQARENWANEGSTQTFSFVTSFITGSQASASMYLLKAHKSNNTLCTWIKSSRESTTFYLTWKQEGFYYRLLKSHTLTADSKAEVGFSASEEQKNYSSLVLQKATSINT